MTPGSRDGLTVTVVVPYFNAAATVSRALCSVARQTHPASEVIIVNDGSAPVAVAALERAAAELAEKGPPIRLLHLAENAGPGTARNRGWAVARSQYVAFLDADDAWHPRKLELQVGWMARSADCVMTGHATAVLGVGDRLPAVDSFDPVIVRPTRLLLGNPFSTPTVMVRADVTARFPEGRRHAEDFTLWLDLAAEGPVAMDRGALTALFKPRYGYAGLSGDLWRMELGELSALRSQYTRGRIGLVRLSLAQGFSLVKFVRRWFGWGAAHD